ncbi:MAG TPA: glycosyltransferase family A protein [Pyrinomonadaceae bacterium]|nr:glycosyltransferase family A protein [Pyrinomonadaceae bacterium]
MQSTRTMNDSTQTTATGGMPAVSVIVPAYNVSRYIADTLDSVFAQTFDGYEIIVVNDGAPDTEELERVLEPYRERIIYLKQENRGPSAARNTGIRAARAPLVGLLDGDDLWEPEFLSVMLDELERDASIGVLYCDAIYFGDSLEAGRSFMELNPSTGEVTFERLLAQECNITSSVVARRELLERAGLFDEGLRSSEDFDLWLRVLKAGGRVAYLRQPLLRYRRHRASLSADPAWMCRHILRVMEKAERTLTLTDAEVAALRRQQRRYEGELHFNEGKRAFFAGDTETAIASLSKANALLSSRKLAFALRLLRLAPGALLRAYHLRDRFYFRADTKF